MVGDRMVVWLMILGCGGFSSQLKLEAVNPPEAEPGSAMQLVGAGFDETVEATWVHASSRTPAGLQNTGETWTVQTPSLPPGAYTLELVRGDQKSAVEVRILGPAPETPCGRDYEANTQVSMVQRTAIIDRFHPDGKREKVEISLDDIERLELQQLETDGRPCSAILLRRTDGVAVLFEDAETDLSARASTLSRFMEKPLITP